MGVLSKPYKYAFNMIASYLTQLYVNPVQTKSITDCIVACLANYISQLITYGKLKYIDDFLTFGAFGFIFGGTVPHYFYKILSGFLPKNSRSSLFNLFIIERLFFMPAFSFFTLYVLSRLSGVNHENAIIKTSLSFPTVVKANFKYLTLLHFINIYFIPPVFKIIVSNLISLFWMIILSMNIQNKKTSKTY